MGYTVTYKGQTLQPYDRKNAVHLELRKGDFVWDANPTLYIAPWNNQDTQFANPPAILPSVYNVHSGYDLLKLLPWNNPYAFGDLYIAFSGGPAQMPMMTGPNTPPSPNNGFTLGPDETKTIGEYTFTFRGMDLDERAQTARSSATRRPTQQRGGEPVQGVARSVCPGNG